MFNSDNLLDLNDLDLTIIFSEESIGELNKYIEHKIINTHDIEEIKNLIYKYLKIKIIFYQKKINKKLENKQKKFEKKFENKKELISKKNISKKNNNSDLIDLFRDDAINFLRKTT